MAELIQLIFREFFRNFVKILLEIEPLENNSFIIFLLGVIARLFNELVIKLAFNKFILKLDKHFKNNSSILLLVMAITILFN